LKKKIAPIKTMRKDSMSDHENFCLDRARCDEGREKIAISGYQILATGGKTELKTDNSPFPK
jgi:hypothetical protein